MLLPVGCSERSGRSWPASIVLGFALVAAAPVAASTPHPTTFSIVAADPDAGEVGVAVASRFFAVGTVVPHARAGVGAVATQSFADTTFGPRGLELLQQGARPGEILEILLRRDEGKARRQVGIVAADGGSATYTGEGCLEWAGGRHGAGYAVQGNILSGTDVVEAMETAYLASEGRPLAERLLASLRAGDEAGGDRRGKQSAAIVVARARGGYGGHTDRAVDVRVDDHPSPIEEVTRLVGLAMVNDAWNRGWTAFTESRPEDALAWQEEAARRAETAPEMLPEVLYDLAVIRLAAGRPEQAREALRRAVSLNPALEDASRTDPDLEGLRPSAEATGGD